MCPLRCCKFLQLNFFFLRRVDLAINFYPFSWLIKLLTFRTTHKVKTQQVVKSRGHHCGDVELTGYLANVAGPVSLALDLRIDYDRVGSSTDPTLNGQLRYPNNLDLSLNDTTGDNVRKYRTDTSILTGSSGN
jgi:hypothetical protein